jgi:cytochrome c-type biogenesis protein CcmH/NrfG
MLAETGARLGRYEDAERLLTRCLEIAPGFAAARHNLATMLYRQNKSEAGPGQIERLTAATAPSRLRQSARRDPGAAGRIRPAIAIYETMLADYPNQPKGWMSYGHA